MNEIWIQLGDVIMLEGFCKRTFWNKFNAGHFTAHRYIDSDHGGRGGKLLQVGLSCLSKAAQDRYYLSLRNTPQPEAPQAPALSGEGGQAAAPEPVEIDTVPPPSEPRSELPATTGELAPAACETSIEKAPAKYIRPLRNMLENLTQRQEKTAALRYDLVSLYREAKSNAKAEKLSVCDAAEQFVKFYNTGLPYPVLFEEIGTIAKPTLDAWEGKLRASNNNMNILAPRHGMHVKGKCKVTAAEFEYCLKYALRNSQHPVQEAIVLAKEHMEKDGIESPSSTATLRRALMRFKERRYDLWVGGREGDKALNDKVLRYIERDASLLEVGDVLVSDGHTLNFMVRNPYTGKPARATLLGFYDWASRMPAGWHIMMTENIQCVHAALRHAIIRLGKIPKYCYLDNGKAFRSKFFNGVKKNDFRECGFEGLYSRLGIQVLFTKPYNAQAKAVERWWETFGELERLACSYCGTSIENKPAHMMRNEILHRSLHNNYIPTIQEANLAVQAWIEQKYSLRKHRGLNNRRPIDIWEAGKGPGVDEKQLWALMLSQVIKTVGRNGVSWQGLDWYDEALYGFKGRVMLRYDVQDLSRVYIFTPDGADLICEARPTSALHPLAAMSDNPLDMVAVQRANKEKSRDRKQTHNDLRAIAKGIGGINMNYPLMPVEEPRQLTRPEAEAIEAAAANIEVIDLTPALASAEPVMFDSEFDRYEYLFRKQSGGEALPHEDLAFMDEYQASDEYKRQAWYWEQLTRQLKIN